MQPQLGEVGETRSPARMPVWLCPVSELLCIYMYLIVVGAGPEGSSLAELALKDGHEVAIIEASSERARAVLQKCDARVFHACIAQGGILDEADANRADALIATTSDDSANLMAMFQGKERGIKALISMVNHRQHQAMFEGLGVRVLVNPEAIVAKHLYSFLRPEQSKLT